MLKRLEVENSYSYKNNVVFNIAKGENVEELSTHVRGEERWNRGLLPVAAIYGSNASGKTRLIKIIEDIAGDVMGGFEPTLPQDDDTGSFYGYINRRFRFRTELPDETISYFICVVLPKTETEYQLRYSIGSNGVVNESLRMRNSAKDNPTISLYSRVGGVITLGKNHKVNAIINKMFGATSDSQKGYVRLYFDFTELLFPFIARQEDGLLELYKWFSYVKNGLSYNLNVGEARTFSDIAKQVSDSSIFKERLLFVLRGLDPNISDILSEQMGVSRYRMRLLHLSKDGDEFTPLSLSEESAGTQKLIELFPWFSSALDKGQPLIVDELDKMLHTEAFRRIVALFINPKTNPNYAQLIFTAHDTVIMNNKFLRRDEIHLISKDRYGVSNIRRFDAQDINGHMVEPYSDYEEQYRTGLLGAYPDDFLRDWETTGVLK